MDPKDYESIMAEGYRTIVLKCLLHRLEVDGSIWHLYVSNIINLLFFLFHTAYCKICKFWNGLKNKKTGQKLPRPFVAIKYLLIV
jgi:hypothetical protein